MTTYKIGDVTATTQRGSLTVRSETGLTVYYEYQLQPTADGYNLATRASRAFGEPGHAVTLRYPGLTADEAFKRGFAEVWGTALTCFGVAEEWKANHVLITARARCEATRWPEQHDDACAWCAAGKPVGAKT